MFEINAKDIVVLYILSVVSHLSSDVGAINIDCTKTTRIYKTMIFLALVSNLF